MVAQNDKPILFIVRKLKFFNKIVENKILSFNGNNTLWPGKI